MPPRNGKIVDCRICGKQVYKPLGQLLRAKHNYCSIQCSSTAERSEKVELQCKTCGKSFTRYRSDIAKSERRGHKPQYCSISCRDNDRVEMTRKAQEMNQIQYRKQGPNKLEMFGREWLESMGFIRNVDFQEQVTLFDKFTVDVLFPREKLVIQFDGVYWHSKPRRIKMDASQDAYLKKAGYDVIRITDHQFQGNVWEEYQKTMQQLFEGLSGMKTQLKTV